MTSQTWLLLAAFAAFMILRFAMSRVRGRKARQLVAEGAVLLDVRTPAEFQSGHLPGAVNIPVQEIRQRLGELGPERPVVVYCRSGARSSNAAAALKGAGFKQVLNLGAMSAW